MGAFVRPAIVLAILMLAAPLAASVTAPTQAPVATPDIMLLDGIPTDLVRVGEEHLPQPAASTGIGPGSRIHGTNSVDGSFLCTANFIWTDGVELYLGTAGHCIVPTGRTSTHGPGADWNAADTVFDVCVAGCNFGGQSAFIVSGTLIDLGPASYGRRSDSGAAVGNDFGLIRIPPSLYHRIRADMPVWGGPTSGVNPSAIDGKPVCQYGHGMATAETFVTQAKVGVGQFVNAGVGSYQYIIGAMPGDSGSPAVMCAAEADGLHGAAALGIHTHSVVAYTPFKTGTTIAKAKAMTARDFGRSINVVLGS